MNEYYLLLNCDKPTLEKTKDAYLREGFSVYFEDEKTLLVYKSDQENKEAEEKMLKMILSRFRRSMIKSPVSLDLSGIMNRHIDRLIKEDFRNIKFHDAFNDDLNRLLTKTRIKVSSGTSW